MAWYKNAKCGLEQIVKGNLQRSVIPHPSASPNCSIFSIICFCLILFPFPFLCVVGKPLTWTGWILAAALPVLWQQCYYKGKVTVACKHCVWRYGFLPQAVRSACDYCTVLFTCSDVKSSRPKWPRGQSFGLGLEVLASAWPRSRCLIMYRAFLVQKSCKIAVFC